MPSCSIGFWVAITMKGWVSGYVVPSTVTWRSSMASSRADCVFGEARLISSPSTMLANTGPGRNSKCPGPGSRRVTPTTSDGSRSGVNWTRFQLESIDAARALARLVLPTPGTSSISRWPSARRQTSASSTTSGLPWMTISMFAAIALKISEKVVSGASPVTWAVIRRTG